MWCGLAFCVRAWRICVVRPSFFVRAQNFLVVGAHMWCGLGYILACEGLAHLASIAARVSPMWRVVQLSPSVC